MSLESKKRIEKQVSVLATSTLVTTARKAAIEIAETAETVRAIKVAWTGKNSKNSEHLRINLV